MTAVEVKHLSKLFGPQKAVDNISFSVQKGDILGFLGPNGAGKSTTMKILTCFLEATSGQVLISGMDTRTQDLEIRRIIGYLPESNPLYKDMYIKEYLTYVAKLYRLKDSSARVKKMIEMTGLGIEQNKKIGQLSKGYKQRVGLAQAMIHDPEILIMDEPTSGLDPNQLIEIRELIRNIGKNKAVIFSSHIMQEVNALCNRVIIINRGSIVVDGSIDSLKDVSSTGQRITITFDQWNSTIKKQFSQSDKIVNIREVKQNVIEFTASKHQDIRSLLFDIAATAGVRILEMAKVEANIEDLFHQLTIQNN